MRTSYDLAEEFEKLTIFDMQKLENAADVAKYTRQYLAVGLTVES